MLGIQHRQELKSYIQTEYNVIVTSDSNTLASINKRKKKGKSVAKQSNWQLQKYSELPQFSKKCVLALIFMTKIIAIINIVVDSKLYVL